MSNSENLLIGGEGRGWSGWVMMLRKILTNVCNNRARSGSTFFLYSVRPGCHFEREGGATLRVVFQRK